MTSSCRDLFADPGQLLPNHRQAKCLNWPLGIDGLSNSSCKSIVLASLSDSIEALHFACASLEALLRDEAALHSGSTFAVHRPESQNRVLLHSVQHASGHLNSSHKVGSAVGAERCNAVLNIFDQVATQNTAFELVLAMATLFPSPLARRSGCQHASHHAVARNYLRSPLGLISQSQTSVRRWWIIWYMGIWDLADLWHFLDLPEVGNASLRSMDKLSPGGCQ